jgi:uncharacterized protein (DUF2384 family)
MTDRYHFKTLDRLVASLVGGSLSEQWWNSPNKAFDDRCPIDLMNQEEWTKVRDYLIDYAYCK